MEIVLMSLELNLLHKIDVSVIVPCYNVEEHIAKCLDSLLNQDFTSYEIICVDDGSTDNTNLILQRYGLDNPNMIKVITERNEGAWSARLNGIRAAKGEYIAFLDGDDQASPKYLSKLHACAVSTGAELTVCGFSRVHGDGSVASREFCSPRRSISLSDDPGSMITVNPAPWNKLFKSSVLHGLPSIRCKPIMFDDLALLLLAYSNGIDMISFVPDSLVNYYIREGSMINSVGTSQLRGAREVLLEIRRIYEEKKASNSSIEALSVVAFLHLVVSMLFRIVDTSYCEVQKQACEMGRFLDKSFPEWNHSHYLGLPYVLKHGTSMIKLWFAFISFKMGCLPLLLHAYNCLIKVTGFDIKW